MGWDAYDYSKQEELKELNESLTTVVLEWFKKYKRTPNLKSIENIEKYNL